MSNGSIYASFFFFNVLPVGKRTYIPIPCLFGFLYPHFVIPLYLQLLADEGSIIALVCHSGKSCLSKKGSSNLPFYLLKIIDEPYYILFLMHVRTFLQTTYVSVLCLCTSLYHTIMFQNQYISSWLEEWGVKQYVKYRVHS